MKVLGFGDNVIDRFIDRGVDYPGGNCLNFAVFARERGAEAAYLGAFGSDEAGAFLRSELASMGLDISRCVTREGETGIAMVEVVDGDRIFRGGNDGGVTVREPVVLDDAAVSYVAGFDLVHSSVYSASETEVPTLTGLDVLVSYDLSSEEGFRTSEYLDPLARHLDLALLSCSDLGERETDDLLRAVVGAGASMALGTRGDAGAMLFDGSRTHQVAAVPLDPERVADTMGCGDAFLAAFACSLLESGWRKRVIPTAESLAAALRAGAAFAAAQCYVEGAFGHGRRTPT
ncbi:MAG: PfkB family carbohydrate kinase [Pseudolysinimonas sp.]|uniref:PfkB family carbohydrate kinase n=1 Tax=Pseudolysinimonas sp. TaxID=2680009 RepID=UPI003C76E006